MKMWLFSSPTCREKDRRCHFGSRIWWAGPDRLKKEACAREAFWENWASQSKWFESDTLPRGSSLSTERSRLRGKSVRCCHCEGVCTAWRAGDRVRLWCKQRKSTDLPCQGCKQKQVLETSYGAQIRLRENPHNPANPCDSRLWVRLSKCIRLKNLECLKKEIFKWENAVKIPVVANAASQSSQDPNWFLFFFLVECNICKSSYHLTRTELLEFTCEKCSRALSHFVGLMQFSQISLGQPEWGYNPLEWEWLSSPWPGGKFLKATFAPLWQISRRSRVTCGTGNTWGKDWANYGTAVVCTLSHSFRLISAIAASILAISWYRQT